VTGDGEVQNTETVGVTGDGEVQNTETVGVTGDGEVPDVGVDEDLEAAVSESKGGEGDVFSHIDVGPPLEESAAASDSCAGQRCDLLAGRFSRGCVAWPLS
jgi:hypothetical protein